MSRTSFFDQIDAMPLAIATERFSLAFLSAHVRIGRNVAEDPRISPEAMVAGLCKTHAAGLASAIAASAQLVGGDRGVGRVAFLRDQLVDDCAAYIRSELAR